MLWLLVWGIALSAKNAQANSINFTLIGTIPAMCEITNDDIPANVNLDLTITTVQNVGNLTYTCNDPQGFTRTITSQNNGKLEDTNSNVINYVMSHTGDGGLTFNNNQLTVPKIDSLNNPTVFAQGEQGTITIRLPSINGNEVAGTYTDQITVNLTAN